MSDFNTSLIRIYTDFPLRTNSLAAKKVKKKDIATIDHSKVAYEPFRKDFYRPAPEVEAMDDEDVDLLRLTMDSIKIRGVDCPKPVTKWSHCGLPTAT